MTAHFLRTLFPSTRMRGMGILLGMVGFLFLANCGRPTSVPPGLLRLAYSAEPASLDPAQSVDVVGGAATAMLYEGLVTIDREGRIAPGVAASFASDSTGSMYTFDLDPNARASDGTPITTKEVRASFLRLLDPKHPSPRAWILDAVEGAGDFARGTANDVSGIRIVDAATMSIRLREPRAAFLGLLAMPSAAILSASLDVTGSVTTGPWVLLERVAGSHLRFQRNPHWHGAAPKFEEVLVRILPDEFTRVAEFEVGNLDLLEVPASQSAKFREDPRWSGGLKRQVLLATEYIGLNCEDPVLRDPRLRVALNEAVDVNTILQTIMGGRGERAQGSVPPGIPGGGAGILYDYAPESARRRLAEVNVPSGWKLQMWQRPNPLVSQVLEAVQANLKAVGIESEIFQRDWGALKASIDQGEAQSFYMNWYADYPDPENFLVPLFHSSNIGGGGNRARFRDAGIDVRLRQLEALTSPEARFRLARELDSEIHSKAPWIVLWHPVQEIATSNRVTNWTPHPVASCERWIDIAPVAAVNAP